MREVVDHRRIPLFWGDVPTTRSSALLVRGTKSYTNTVKAIKGRINPKEFENVHFNKSRKGELLIRFSNTQTVEDELKSMRDKLADISPEMIQNAITLGRLDRILIKDIDPTIVEPELLEALKAIVPEKYKGIIRINGFWQTSSGLAKAVASVPRGVFSVVRRIKVGFFLCRVQQKALPLPIAISATISGTLARRVGNQPFAALAADVLGTIRPKTAPWEMTGA